MKTTPLAGDPVAQFPKMKVGDKYTFVISGMDQEVWEVTSVNSDGSFVLRVTSGGSAARQEIKVDNSYRLISDERTMLGNIKIDFPLFPEKRWSYTYVGEDFGGRQVTWIFDYHIVGYETVQMSTGPVQVFKIAYRRSSMNSSFVGSFQNIDGELWYAPDIRMIVYIGSARKSHKLLAYALMGDPGRGSLARPALVQGAMDKAMPSAGAHAAETGTAAGGKTEAVRQAEEKVAAALKAQQEKEAALKVQAQRLAEKEAALKAEANRLAEEKLAAEAKRLEEQEAALKAEAARLESARREAAVRAQKERDVAVQALAAARAREESENIEVNIPAATRPNPDAIAVVIGNRDYKNARTVSFAINDAELMKRYLVSTLGFKDGNVFLVTNASKSEFELLFGNERNYRGKLFNAVKEGRSDVFIYYSGHGAPGLKDRKGYFVPVEADPQYLELNGYPLDVLYENLAKLPARSVTVALDACFSGSTVYENISPLVLEVQNPAIRAKNMVIMASAAGTQVSSWYNEKNHSMFTYFLLRALKDPATDRNKDGKLTFEELYSFVADKSEGVPYYARRINGVEQNPTISGQYQGKVFLSY
jgi:hypothetical protein